MSWGEKRCATFRATQSMTDIVPETSSATSMRPDASNVSFVIAASSLHLPESQHTSAYICQHMSAYVSIRQRRIKRERREAASSRHLPRV